MLLQITLMMYKTWPWAGAVLTASALFLEKTVVFVTGKDAPARIENLSPQSLGETRIDCRVFGLGRNRADICSRCSNQHIGLKTDLHSSSHPARNQAEGAGPTPDRHAWPT